MTETTSPLELAWAAPREAPADALPHPTTGRWQPLRLGLVDLFYYDDEQFWFHDGRLLLRGNNGTGKSKVLALTLPFLLDGSVLPRRVEPDADPKKRMEWNLLLGGAHPHSERTGYSWVEFGRVDPDGTEHFTTLGIGLKAAAGRGIVKTWYFLTSRRIGELRLMGPDRVVLTQERLRDELAGTGQVLGTQEAYRRAVDEALFRLGPERYAALIDLLIQLRQPQLSKRPDEKALSAALTEALAPLDQAVLADVAESFRSLEEEQAGVSAARQTLAAAEAFLDHYRSYARVAARRRTTAVREANSDYERAGRNLREAETARDAAAEEVRRLGERHDELTRRRSALEGERTALRESPEMRDAQQLDAARVAAEEKETSAEEAEREATESRERAEREGRLAAQAAAAHEKAATEADRTAAAAAEQAARAGLAEEHARAGSEEAAARRAVARRRDQVAHVRRLADASRGAADRAGHRRALLDEAEAEAARRGEAVTEAEAAVEAAVAGHRDAVATYLAGLRVLAVPAGDLVGLAEEWARSQEGHPPVRAAVERARAAALEQIARERAAAEQDERGLAQQLGEVRDQIAALEQGRDPEPPPAPGRDVAARATRPGAPLWRVADFADWVAEDERAGLEAALTSAGLLDAWVFPDGTLAADGDVVVGPTGPQAEASLATVLVPAVGPAEQVDAAVVADVLGRIGLGEASGAPVWVDAAGRWGAGPARGSWAKPRAEFIGAGAREAHRRDLLAQLRERADGLERELAGVRERLEAARDRAAAVAAEAEGYPAATERDLTVAHTRASAARRELGHAEEAVRRAQAAWEQAVAEAERAAAELADQAGQLGLGTTPESLEETDRAITDYQAALTVMWSAARELVHAAAHRDQAAERADEAAGAAERRETQARALRSQAAGLRARCEALQATVGASVAELQERLSRVGAAIDHTTSEIEQLQGQRFDAVGREAALRQQVADLEERRQEAARVREHQVEELRGFAATGLLRVALPELETPDAGSNEEWTITAALGLSRLAEQRLEDVDASEDAWSAAQQRVSSASTELATQMGRHGHLASVEQRGEVLLARVRYGNEELDVDRLATRLAGDIEERERLLSAREREIIENYLVDEVAGHLHERLLDAEAQIDRMNRELAERKTSTGMQLRVRWRERADAPAGLSAARELMLRSDATWTAEDRSAIGEFLQARIREVRAGDPSGSWQEHLEQALDYRQWHSFVVERLQNGQWRSASGPASGGEKALAVTIPLFAAASAHYNSAGTQAPRLILLDEAFAGVDDDSRAKSLGLLATFDLDVVMTSEREWGCYPQVPGLSIAQLSRVDGVDAVGVTRWRWDGRRRERVAEVDQAARAGTPVQEQPGEQPLFG